MAKSARRSASIILLRRSDSRLRSAGVHRRAWLRVAVVCGGPGRTASQASSLRCRSLRSAAALCEAGRGVPLSVRTAVLNDLGSNLIPITSLRALGPRQNVDFDGACEKRSDGLRAYPSEDLNAPRKPFRFSEAHMAP